MVVIAKVAPFFLLMLAGGVLTRTRLLDAAGVLGLSRYVYWIGFPSLLIAHLGHAARPGPDVLRGLGGYLAGGLVPLVAALAIGRILRWPGQVRAGLPMCATLGNSGFLGLPLALSLLGPQVGGWGAAIIAIDWVILAALTGMALHGGSVGPATALRRGLFTPVVAGAVIGTVQMILGWRWPGPIDAAISFASASATGVGLAALGATLAAQSASRGGEAGVTPPVWTAIGLKLLLYPAAVGLATRLAGAPPAFTALAMLMGACPTAVTVFVQARSTGVFVEGAARAVALSTLLSALTLPAVGALLVR